MDYLLGIGQLSFLAWRKYHLIFMRLEFILLKLKTLSSYNTFSQLTAFQLRNLLKMFPSLVTLDAVEPEDPLNFGIDDLPRTSLLCDFNVRKRGYNILDEWAL